jgi:hypothetical protein
MMTININISIEIITKQKLTKKNVRKAQERLSVEVLDSTALPNAFTMKKGYLYTNFRVLVLPGRPSAIDRTLGAFERTRARISAPDGHNCVRTQKRAFERRYFRIGQNL